MDSTNNKISVTEYINNNDLLVVTYLPFDTKMNIVSHILNSIISSVGGLNTSLLRRISTEVFINSITNIDMNIEDENGLRGFDTLLFTGKLNQLKSALDREYSEFELILDERVNDYIRTETNPSVTINAIYDQIRAYLNTAMDYLSERIKDIDVSQIANELTQYISNNESEEVIDES